LDGERVTIKLDDGAELMALPQGEWREGERIEVVIRAQKFDLLPKDHQQKEAGVNYFDGRIKARSYMGGEVRYFAETKTGAVVHIIGGIRSQLFRRGDEVMIEFSPKDCHLLPGDYGS
jgi:ABC-type Fe3+/spermidine/putrescine transport system ATPase subunit